MSLLAWFPLNSSTTNIGAGDFTFYSSATTFSHGGKLSNYCLYFNGSAQAYIANPFIGLNEWSLAFWFCPDTPGAWTDLFTFSGQSDRLEYGSPTTSLYWFSNNTNYNILTSGTLLGSNITNNAWHHFIITFNNGTVTVYLDGEQTVQQTGKTTFTDAAIYLYFGSRISSMYAKQYLQDIRCYDHVLSKLERRNLNRGLIVHYNFEDMYENVQYISYTFPTFTSGIQVSNTDYNKFILDCEIHQKITTTSSSNHYVIGNATVTTTSSLTTVVYNWGVGTAENSDYYVVYNGSTTTTTTVPVNQRVIITYDYTTKLLTINDYSLTVTFQSKPNYIFEKGGSAILLNTCQGYLYNFKCLDTAKKLIYDYQPAVNRIAGNVGIQDTITKIFAGISGEAAAYPDKTQKVVPDISGNSLHANPFQVIINNNILKAGKGAIPLYFPYSGQLTLSAERPTYNDSFSIIMWVNAGSTYNNHAEYLFYNSAMQVYFDSTYIYFVQGTSTLQAAFNLYDSTWHQIACVYKKQGNIQSIYIDGANPVQTGGTSTGPSLSLGYIGRAPSIDYYYGGHISDFRLYSTALSAADIKELYKAKTMVDSNCNLYCNSQYSTNGIQITKAGVLGAQKVVSGSSSIIVNNTDKYIQLEYIDSNGDNAYIDTGVIPTINTAITVRFNAVTYDITHCYVFTSGGVAATSNMFSCRSINNGYLTCLFGNKNPDLIAPQLNTVIDFYLNKTGYGYSYGSYSRTGTYTSPSFNTCIGSIYLLANYSETSPDTISTNTTPVRIYACKVWEKDKLIRDFIPVKRVDGEIGLYDTINGQFYGSSGEDPFVAGPELGLLNILSCNNFYSDDGAAVAEPALLSKKLTKNYINVTKNTGVSTITVVKTLADGSKASEVFSASGSCESAINYPYSWSATAESGYTLNSSSGSDFLYVNEIYGPNPKTISPTASYRSYNISYTNQSASSAGSCTTIGASTYTFNPSAAQTVNLGTYTGTGDTSSYNFTFTATCSNSTINNNITITTGSDLKSWTVTVSIPAGFASAFTIVWKITRTAKPVCLCGSSSISTVCNCGSSATSTCICGSAGISTVTKFRC